MKQAHNSSSMSKVRSHMILCIPIAFLVSPPLLKPNWPQSSSSVLLSVLLRMFATVLAVFAIRLIVRCTHLLINDWGSCQERNWRFYVSARAHVCVSVRACTCLTSDIIVTRMQSPSQMKQYKQKFRILEVDNKPPCHHSVPCPVCA
jgi:hypothetical protein